jgi:anti-sigma factor RsiW
MDCQDFLLRMDGYREGSLTRAEHNAVADHLFHCPRCRDRIARAERLRAALRELPAPPMRPGFFQQALARIGALPARRRSRWTYATGTALAASVALWLGFSWLTATAPQPSATVTITLNEPRTIQLEFNAERALPQATIRLQLPEGVEVQGFPSEREIRWETDLARGVNMLSLPLVATSTTGGALRARLEHGNRATELAVKLQVNTRERAGALPGRMVSTIAGYRFEGE